MVTGIPILLTLRTFLFHPIVPMVPYLVNPRNSLRQPPQGAIGFEVSHPTQITLNLNADYLNPNKIQLANFLNIFRSK